MGRSVAASSAIEGSPAGVRMSWRAAAAVAITANGKAMNTIHGGAPVT